MGIFLGDSSEEWDFANIGRLRIYHGRYSQDIVAEKVRFDFGG